MTDDRLGELTKNIDCAKKLIVIGACYSGEFLDDCSDTNTIVISQTSSDALGYYYSNNGIPFMDLFYEGLKSCGGKVEDAFDYAEDNDPTDDIPQMEDNYTSGDMDIDS